MTPKHKVGDNVVIRVCDVDSHHRDVETMLYIPRFFLELEGREYTITRRILSENCKTGGACYRYYLDGEYIDKYGISVDIDNFMFDEHWLSEPSGMLECEEVKFF